MSKKEIFVSVVNVVLLIVCVVVAVFKIRCLILDTLANENEIKKLNIELEKLKEDHEDEIMLNLSCSGEVLVFGAINGIHREQLPSLEVTTPYSITMYQVIDKNGVAVQSNKYENNTSTKLNKFNIEGVGEEVTQIRLFGFNTSGEQVVCKNYDIVFLE